MTNMPSSKRLPAMTDVTLHGLVWCFAAHGVAAQLRIVMILRVHMLQVSRRVALVVFCTAPICAWAATGVPAPVTQVITAQRLPLSAVSFAIVDADSGRV